MIIIKVLGGRGENVAQFWVRTPPDVILETVLFVLLPT